MDMALRKCYYLFVLVFCIVTINAVPPDACFENFRFDDCGLPPKPVIYYWKPGSRCEVGIWRGCLPNPNMFHDEYECINTCIFVARAQPEDYHSHLKLEEYPEDVTLSAEVTDSRIENATESSANETTSGNDTTTLAPDSPGEENSTASGDETTIPGETTGTGAEPSEDTETTAEPPPENREAPDDAVLPESKEAPDNAPTPNGAPTSEDATAASEDTIAPSEDTTAPS